MNFRNSGNWNFGFGWSHALAVAALAGVPNLPALALDSDKNQPATLEADDFELDLATGVRTYRGGVVFRQGSIHLDCDKLVTYYGEDEKLEKGVCTGNPGRFKQRPEGRDDVHGRARSITLDRVRGVGDTGKPRRRRAGRKPNPRPLDHLRSGHQKSQSRLRRSGGGERVGERNRRPPAPDHSAAHRTAGLSHRPMGHAMKSLEARGLVKKYDQAVIVDRVDLKVSDNEVVGLLGANGAGKTTSFNMIIGLVRQTEGAIFLDGEDITALPMHRRARRGIGYLPQEHSVFRKLTAAQNILAVLEAAGKHTAEQRLQISRSLMAEFGIEHLRDKPAIQLSGGEQRRVEIARCAGAGAGVHPPGRAVCRH